MHFQARMVVSLCACALSVAVPADPHLKAEPLQAQLHEERSQTDLTEAAQKLRTASIGESAPITPRATPPAALPAELPGAGAPAGPSAMGEPASAAEGQAHGQQPAHTPGISAAHVQQQVASAFQQTTPNPFSSAFAYTERMNSAFTSN